MIASVSCRNPFCALGSLQFGNWAQGTSDRGGQDKARRVRAVGWGKRVAISTMLQTLHHIERTLRCLLTRSRRSTFDTL